MSLTVDSRRKNLETLQAQHPDAVLLDVTSRGEMLWVKFSPFYPHGNIPIPLSPGHVSASVEGIWQGLKVFQSADIDPAKFAITTMSNLKRTVRRYGPVLGHRAGVEGEALLPYRDARYLIYLPAYRWVLENALQREVEMLKDQSEDRSVVLLDYETNGDIENVSKPLSHAWLIVKYITGQWPEQTETS